MEQNCKEEENEKLHTCRRQPKENPANLITATSDDNLRDLFHQIRTSKTPVSVDSTPSTFFFIPTYTPRFEMALDVLNPNLKLLLQAVINYGASWCRVCSQILPVFCDLSNSFPKLSFVYADIDDCPETTQHVRYTPTFHFYQDGERVDEMIGAGEERLHDRLWLHS
ncbi:unnamed protein product [Cuscuta epithymum]|uniref:Thioredoxin domain-containing protein n=1 Tax=Cuscuta epithymum TaxID=186058 RepID=A0AAV0FJL0_9ASTE|nr:unnamed protein product [Cuscuta epithymum]